MYTAKQYVLLCALNMFMFALLVSFSHHADSKEQPQKQSTIGHHLQQQLGNPISNFAGSIVSPDGSGLPVGQGSVLSGEVIYKARCVSCHGVDGKFPGNLLVGGKGSLASAKPVKTIGSYWPYATTIYDYIARAMPYNEEKSLTADEVYSLTAYLLYLNEVIPKDSMVSQNNLADINMPNKNGFIELH